MMLRDFHLDIDLMRDITFLAYRFFWERNKTLQSRYPFPIIAYL